MNLVIYIIDEMVGLRVQQITQHRMHLRRDVRHDILLR